MWVQFKPADHYLQFSTESQYYIQTEDLQGTDIIYLLPHQIVQGTFPLKDVGSVQNLKDFCTVFKFLFFLVEDHQIQSLRASQSLVQILDLAVSYLSVVFEIRTDKGIRALAGLKVQIGVKILRYEGTLQKVEVLDILF